MSHTYGRGHHGLLAAAAMAVGAWLGAKTAQAMFRYRWHLLPLLVAGPLPILGWITALTYWAWPAWTLAGYAVGGLCAAVWVWLGIKRLYDKVLGAVASALCLAWTLAVAVDPGAGALYGLWLLGWPVIGLFWWCGGAFRSGRALAQLRRRWSNIADLAGIAKAKLIRAEDTEVGQVLTVELPGDKTQGDVSKTRLESAMATRPGAVHIVKDSKNARRVTIHHTAIDPWEDGSEVTHPLMALVTALSAATGTDAQHTDLEDAA